MAKTLYELRQLRAEEELAALQTIADHASAADSININTEENGPFIEVLTPAQESRVVAQKQLDLLREARERGKDDYEECHLRFLALIQERRAELIDTLFGETKGMDASALVTASLANEEALRNMAKVAATSENEALGQAVLLSAYEKEMDAIHELIRLLDDADEDEDGTLGELFSELFEIDVELANIDVNVFGEELRVRYDALVPIPSLEDLMPGSPKRGILLGSR
jgi:hypothetical protein